MEEKNLITIKSDFKQISDTNTEISKILENLEERILKLKEEYGNLSHINNKSLFM